MSTSSRGSYHHGDLAATLEQAAVELLATQSAASLSLREVARRAGVSHNAPYRHYGDRQELLKAVAARSLRELLAAMVSAREAGTDPGERLVAVGLAYVDYAIDHPGSFGAIFDPDICDPHEPNPVTAPLIAANDELLLEVVREVVPDADPDEVAATAAALWGTVHGLAILVSAGHLARELVRPGLQAVVGWRGAH